MKFDVLHNFISPVTGRVLSDYNYVLVGNRAGIAIPSPILIDIRLDLIALRKRYNSLVQTDFIIGHPNTQIPNAQVLVNLANGFLYNTAGIVSTLPTFQQLPLCYAATTEDLGAIYNNGAAGVGATLTNLGLGTFTIDDQTPPINSIILVKDQSSSYENGIYTVTNTGGVITPWVLTRLGTYDQPMEIQSGDIVTVQFGTVNAQTLWVETQTVTNIGTDPILFIPFSLFNTLPENNIWIGNDMNQPIPNPTIALGNLPDLTYQYIWRGDSENRPAEVNDLTILEGKVNLIEEEIATIEAEILELQGQIVALEAQIAILEDEIVALTASILVLQTQILIIQGQIAALNTRIDNLRLNNIPADADVSLYNNRIINLADPLYPQDAVNLRTLKMYIPSEYPITLIGDVTGSGPSDMPIVTTLVKTLNNINNDGDVNINNFKLVNITDPTNAQDGVNLRTLNYYVGGLALDGFIVGGPPVGGLFITTRGPTCLLTNIPAGGDVSIDNYAITNLETLSFSSWNDMENKAQNGLNFLFLWQFFGGGVS